MRRSQGGWANDLGIFLGNGKLSVCHNEVEQEDEGRQSIALDTVLEEHRLTEAGRCAG